MAKKNQIVVREVSDEKLPLVVYGLKGIMDVFGCKKHTAFKYRHGIIKDACTQQGKKIIVDVRKALTLYGVKDVDSLVSNKRTQIERL